MLVIPAIDLKDGQCVRLRQGKMEESTVFSDDPIEMAGHWVEQGAQRPVSYTHLTLPTICSV